MKTVIRKIYYIIGNIKFFFLIQLPNYYLHLSLNWENYLYLVLGFKLNIIIIIIT